MCFGNKLNEKLFYCFVNKIQDEVKKVKLPRKQLIYLIFGDFDDTGSAVLANEHLANPLLSIDQETLHFGEGKWLAGFDGCFACFGCQNLIEQDLE